LRKGPPGRYPALCGRSGAFAPEPPKRMAIAGVVRLMAEELAGVAVEEMQSEAGRARDRFVRSIRCCTLRLVLGQTKIRSIPPLLRLLRTTC
jgi:hypothetical protein